MIIKKEIFNSFPWSTIGLSLQGSLLMKEGETIAFIYEYSSKLIEVQFDAYTMSSRLSEFEKEYVEVQGWDRYTKWFFNYHLGVDDLPRNITPDIWEEFTQVKGSKRARISWMYKRTGKKGLLTTLVDGTLYPFSLTREVIIDGEIVRVKPYHDYTQYIRYDYTYYSLDTPFYTINGTDVPLSVIIERGNICEEHGVYIGDECPLCTRKYTIHSYSTRAENTLPFKDDGEATPEYMGIELEYEDCLGEKRAVYNALAGHVILKRDGSIHSGFEIVTCPATLAVHKKAFSGFYSKVALGVKSNCGMHVHVAKKAMNEMQIGKIISFLYNKENIPVLEKLAGRSYSTNSYCQAKYQKKVTHNLQQRYNFQDKLTRKSDGKYEALNTSPAHTLEFRIFAPPKDEATLFMRLEFVQALVDWTKPAVCSVKDAVNWEKFKAFVGKYRKSYPNLGNTLFGKKTPDIKVWVDEFILAA